ncbi:MAG: ATP-binding protein, partial [Acidobacteria bacterium]|nr:ATP-binding protein [Acidobacteriota bacterium]
VDRLFGTRLDPPVYIAERGEITMTYRESQSDAQLDLSSSGRGLQQTLLLLAYLYSHPGAALLLDEPDAHLEILRQSQTYQVLTDIAEEQGSQIIAASHSEVILNEAADRDMVISFVGRPHRVDDRGTQTRKALKAIGYEQYYLAEQTGWVIYLEGSTDLAILRAFAETLNHPSRERLERPFAHYVENQPQRARDHFYGLREALPSLSGMALFDRLEQDPPQGTALLEATWRRREIENYLCYPEVLLAYAERPPYERPPAPLFADHRRKTMEDCIADISAALVALGKAKPFTDDIKASDEFLDPLFRRYFETLGLPNLMQKTDYHVLARLVPRELISPEVVEKLGAIEETARKARPVESV